MIQRPQSLFLLAAAALLVAFLVSLRPWATALGPGTEWLLPVIYGLSTLAALGALVAIGLFKDRARQRSVVNGVRWLSLLLVACVAAGVYVAVQGAAAGTALYISGLLPLGSYVALRFALRGILKDIERVRSADRLR